MSDSSKTSTHVNINVYCSLVYVYRKRRWIRVSLELSNKRERSSPVSPNRKSQKHTRVLTEEVISIIKKVNLRYPCADVEKARNPVHRDVYDVVSPVPNKVEVRF